MQTGVQLGKGSKYSTVWGTLTTVYRSVFLLLGIAEEVLSWMSCPLLGLSSASFQKRGSVPGAVQGLVHEPDQGPGGRVHRVHCQRLCEARAPESLLVRASARPSRIDLVSVIPHVR